MYKNNDICPICGDGHLEEKIIEETFEYKGRNLIVPDYRIFQCPSCGEELVDPLTIKETEKTIRDFQREIDGLLTSDQIRQIRTDLGYTQEELGKILGGGVKSFARYENGTVTQSRAMDNLLRILKKYPHTLNAITTVERKVKTDKCVIFKMERGSVEIDERIM